VIQNLILQIKEQHSQFNLIFKEFFDKNLFFPHSRFRYFDYMNKYQPGKSSKNLKFMT